MYHVLRAHLRTLSIAKEWSWCVDNPEVELSRSQPSNVSAWASQYEAQLQCNSELKVLGANFYFTPGSASQLRHGALLDETVLFVW